MSGTATVTTAVVPSFSVFLRNLFAVGKKLERRRIQTVSISGRWRTVRENMTLMSPASCTSDLDSPHSVAVVGDLAEMILIERRVERRPSGTRIKFVLRSEQRQAAKPARVGSVLFIVEKRSAERCFRPVIQKDAILFFVKVLSQAVSRFVRDRSDVVA